MAVIFQSSKGRQTMLTGHVKKLFPEMAFWFSVTLLAVPDLKFKLIFNNLGNDTSSIWSKL